VIFYYYIKLLVKGEYIKNLNEKVKNLEYRLVRSIENCHQIKLLMSKWENLPLFERANGGLLQLEDKETRLKDRYSQLKDVGEKIHGLLRVSYI